MDAQRGRALPAKMVPRDSGLSVLPLGWALDPRCCVLALGLQRGRHLRGMSRKRGLHWLLVGGAGDQAGSTLCPAAGLAGSRGQMTPFGLRSFSGTGLCSWLPSPGLAHSPCSLPPSSQQRRFSSSSSSLASQNSFSKKLIYLFFSRSWHSTFIPLVFVRAAEDRTRSRSRPPGRGSALPLSPSPSQNS